MPLILRNLKQNHSNNAEFRKFLLYAMGEKVLKNGNLHRRPRTIPG